MTIVDVGRSVLIDTLGNILCLLARRLSYTLHKMRYQCQIYRADRKPVDEYLGKKVEVSYSEQLDKASKVRQELSKFFSFRWVIDFAKGLWCCDEC